MTEWGRRAGQVAAVAAGAGLLLLAQACGSDATGPRQGGVVTMHASWAEHYSDLTSLKKDADLVVLGTVSGVAGRTVSSGVPYTDFTVTVTRRLHDPATRLAPSSSTVVVHQTGGTVSGVTTQVEDDVLFRPGESVVLFLREYSPGRYRVLGGPAGRFEVSRGLVTPASRSLHDLPAQLPLETFTSQVARA